MKEISPREISGTLTSFKQIILVFGIFFTFAISSVLDRILNDPSGEKKYRIMFGMGTVIVSVQTFFLMTKYNFETPKYLY